MRGFIPKYYNWTSNSKESVQDYFKALAVPLVSEERTPAGHVEGNYPQWGDEQHMDWAHRMEYMQPGRVVLLLLTKVSLMMTILCVVAELVDIRADSHISERVYDRISQWSNRILLPYHTLPGDYYSMKKLIKNLGLPIEKINACRNGCMLYWKDDVGLEYCKFCGDTRCKPSLERDLHRKKSLYAVLRYLPLTPHLERLYSSRPRNVRRGLCAVGSAAAGASSSQVLAGRGMHHRHQCHYFPHRPRGIILASRMRDLNATFTLPSIMWSKGIIRIPGPTSCRSHRSTNYSVLQISYWWDCNDESMFKVVKSQAEKFLLWLTEDIWRQLLEFWVSPEFQT
ncbi:UNVERIFIED_CONTAM: hypothetical protein Sradi_0880200 [Sesamum radiatum]|uniref:Uncharacterized protein n=1 Tax=Sesamum radiatum TaxID=300843 RepID=A0AAW2V1X8_SESRA